MGRQRNIGQQIRALRDKGYTYDKIKAELNCSKSTISYHVNATQPAKTAKRTGRLEERIREWIHQYKESNPCADCGNYYHYWQVGFDHLPGMVKSFNISKFKQYTKDLNVVVAEAAKCEVVCHNCHSTRTHLRTNHDSEMFGVYPDELD